LSALPYAVPAPSLPPALRATALRAAGAAGAALALASLHVQRPATFCLLRAATGIPCPLCGSTTAYVRAGRGDLLGALLANPVTLLAGVVLVLAPLLSRRVHVPPRAVPWLLTCTVAFAWTWQLARFDRLPF
jgi:hypothetical protein